MEGFELVGLAAEAKVTDWSSGAKSTMLAPPWKNWASAAGEVSQRGWGVLLKVRRLTRFWELKA